MARRVSTIILLLYTARRDLDVFCAPDLWTRALHVYGDGGNGRFTVVLAEFLRGRNINLLLVVYAMSVMIPQCEISLSRMCRLCCRDKSARSRTD